MLLPIGQENSEVRRQPWVSYALIAANVAFFVMMSLLGDGGAQQRELADRFGAVWRYLVEHPYLTTPPRLERQLGEQARLRLHARLEQARDQAPTPAPDALDAEQARLEELTDAFTAALDRTPFRRFGLVPARGPSLTWITHMFVHANVLHLLGNMLFLFLSGPFVEDLYGRPLFAALYFVSGLAAAGVHASHFPASEVPLVGASGAIAGVMGAFLVRLGRARIRFLWTPLFPFLWIWRLKFLLPAFVVLPLWFGEQLLYARLAGAESGVGFWAHVGGFACGALAAVAIHFSGVESRLINPAIEDAIGIAQHPALEAAVDACTRGDLARARRELARLLAAQPENPDGWTAAMELAIAEGRAAEAERWATRLLELHIRNGERGLATGLIGEARDRLGDALGSRFLMTAATFLERDGDARAAIELLGDVGDRWPNDAVALRAHFHRGEILARAGDDRAARQAFERARQHPSWNEQLAAAAVRTLAQRPRRSQWT